MPTVPTYDAPQVAATGLPGASVRSNASPSLFNAGAAGSEAALQINQNAARGAMSLGNTMLDIGIKMQQQQDLDVLFQQETALKDGWVDFQSKAKQRNGADAAGLTADADAWFQQQAQDLSKNFTTLNQQRAFARTFAQMREQALSSMSSYETQEREKSVLQSAEASMNSSINLAASAALDAKTNPAPVAAQSRDDILKRLDVVGKMQGWTPEILADKKAQSLDKLHMSVIAAMIDQRPAMAKSYMQANKDEISGVSQAKVRDWLDTIAKRNEGEAILATAQSFADDAVNKGMSEYDAINAARAKFSGKQEEQVVNALKVRYNERQSSAADAAWNAFQNGGGRLDAVPVSIFNDLSAKDKAALQEAAANGMFPKQSDRGVLADLYSLEARGDLTPDVVRRASAHLNQGDYQKFMDSANSPDKQRTASIDADDFNTLAVKSQRFDPFSTKPEDKAKIGELRSAIESRIDEEQTAKKRVLSRDEKKAVMQSVLDNKVFVDEWGRDPEKLQYQLSAADRQNAYVVVNTPITVRPTRFSSPIQTTKKQTIYLRDISKEERSAIINKLSKLNMPITEQSIAEAWASAKQKQSEWGK
ncbi:hypothetical protein G3T20_05320 [Bordetella hinzii]|uniref:hypothetical protein n=1 Tax=Bordetella hinzii TaxID=103855 RepID=UPI0013EFE0BE|nr:hypothetical protein [Bordetella hinzii]QII84172.1 hypothetical protein G3T20_05320 [Bordetella hinzii]